jgi:hypothetical protein
MSDSIKRCAACRKEKRVSEMKVCMHNQMHRYVCDSTCMNDFYNPPKKPAAPEPVQGEAVAWQSRFIESGDAWDAWQTCAKEHHDLVKRCPNEWPDYEVRALYAAAAKPDAEQEPVLIEAVAVTRENEDGELYLDWILEGGISALEEPGQLLLIAHGQITGDEGSGEVYTAPPSPANHIPDTTKMVDADLVGLLKQVVAHLEGEIFAPFGEPATPFDREIAALVNRIDAKIAELRQGES